MTRLQRLHRGLWGVLICGFAFVTLPRLALGPQEGKELQLAAARTALQAVFAVLVRLPAPPTGYGFAPPDGPADPITDLFRTAAEFKAVIVYAGVAYLAYRLVRFAWAAFVAVGDLWLELRAAAYTALFAPAPPRLRFELAAVPAGGEAEFYHAHPAAVPYLQFLPLVAATESWRPFLGDVTARAGQTARPGCALFVTDIAFA